MKSAGFHLALVLVSLAVIAFLLAANRGRETSYRLTVLNLGASSVSGGTVVVSQRNAPQTYVIPRLHPGGSVGFEGVVRGDCAYQISVERESGVSSRDTLSPLTMGLTSVDTIFVADSSVSLRSRSRALDRTR